MKLAAMAGLLIAVIIVSGCTQTEYTQTRVTIDDFNSALDGLEINGIEPNLMLDTNVGGVLPGIINANWPQANNDTDIFLKITAYTDHSIAQDFYDIIKEKAITLFNSTLSELSIAGETISKLVSETSIISYIWVYDNFYFVITMYEDTDLYKPIAERVVDVYK